MGSEGWEHLLCSHVGIGAMPTCLSPAWMASVNLGNYADCGRQQLTGIFIASNRLHVVLTICWFKSYSAPLCVYIYVCMCLYILLFTDLLHTKVIWLYPKIYKFCTISEMLSVNSQNWKMSREPECVFLLRFYYWRFTESVDDHGHDAKSLQWRIIMAHSHNYGIHGDSESVILWQAYGSMGSESTVGSLGSNSVRY